ncbi:MAG: 5-methyltetrahydropteroyltriglutamate--homocysteine methyltransferase, partial [Candidatus Latescibacteria bacterium]|nr:5-methyltetrahydropteroyltriglutamate--homocysteine methyltransferase [Candidatus Latescibacterota bacterium]
SRAFGTRDASAAVSGGYGSLMDVLKRVDVGTLFLELCTERAGDVDVLKAVPDDKRVGVGVVNQKLDAVEMVEDIQRRISDVINLFGKERVLLTPDCGFATFADNPVASANVAEAKLKAIVDARDLIGGG